MTKATKATTSRLGFMKFYPGDWINDNISLTHEEFGVYMRMAFRYWTRDGLPWTPEDIAEDIGDRGGDSVETIKLILVKKFTKGRGKKWVHEELDAARTEVREYKREKSDDGKAGNDIKRKSEDEKPNKPNSMQGGEGEKLIKPLSGANKDTYRPPATSLTTSATSTPPTPPTPSAAAVPDVPSILPQEGNLYEFPIEEIPPRGTPQRGELLKRLKESDPEKAQRFTEACILKDAA